MDESLEEAFKVDQVSIRLVKDAPLLSDEPLTSPEKVVEKLSEMMSEFDREVVGVVNFKADMTPINVHFASMGAINEAVAHPREIMKAAILSNAANMMLLHNHPSGNLTPSKADVVLTDRMNKACELMGIPLTDHIIVGGDNKQFFSFKEKDLIPMAQLKLKTDYHDLDIGKVAEKGTYQAKSDKPPTQVQQITEKLEQGLKDLFQSGKFQDYLKTMSKFHNYSFNNSLLIAMQKPDATMVAGYTSWQKDFKRHVKKGEKGIKIFAPSPYKKKELQDVVDPNTKEPIKDENGKTKQEEVVVKIPAFKVVTVFDASQTEGEPLPKLGVDELDGSVEDYRDFMKALEKVSPVPIEYKEIESGAKGYFSPTNQMIAINEGMSEMQTVKTAVHELAHSLLHDKDNVRMEGIEDVKKDRQTKEVEAESVAYTVCQHFGIDTSEYSFGYLAGWSSSMEMPELKQSMETIQKTADKVITDLSGALHEIRLEKEQEQEKLMHIGEKENTYEIYQLKDDVGPGYAFRSLDDVNNAGLEVKADNYNLVYSGPVEDATNLDALYERFNIDHPEDFKGHSLSVSDIIVLNRDGDVSAKYVDAFGFSDVPEFFPKEKEMDVSLYVAECSEFHGLGEFKENIKSVDEALKTFEEIPAARMNGVKTIGIVVVDKENDLDSMELDIVVGKHIDMDMLSYVPAIKDNAVAQDMIAELIAKNPQMEVRGEIPKEIAEKIPAIREANMSVEEKLAVKLDEFAKGVDPYGYQDDVEDPQANIDMLATDIKSGEVQYLVDFLAPIIEDKDGLLEERIEAQALLNELKEQVPSLEVSEDLLTPLAATVKEETTYQTKEDVIDAYKAKTMEVFHELDGENAESIEKMVKAKAQDMMETMGIDAQVIDAVLVGSRSRGVEHGDSDVEVVVDIKGEVPEEEIKGLLNGENIEVAGQSVLLEPIINDKPMNLASYLNNEESKLSVEQAQVMEIATEKAEREATEKAVKQAGQYGNFKMVKNEQDNRYFLVADVKFPSGEITKNKPIAEFPNKKAIDKFCEKNDIKAEDITGSLKNKIEHKQQITSDKPKKQQSKNRSGSIEDD